MSDCPNCAAMREALFLCSQAFESVRTKLGDDALFHEWDFSLPGSPYRKVRTALASDAGKALLERLEKAERERDEAIAHDRQPYPTAWAYEQACRALEKAERERDEWKRNAEVVESAANAWADDARSLEKKLENARAQALEEAARVAITEARRLDAILHPQNPVAIGAISVALDKLAAAIRALKERK